MIWSVILPWSGCLILFAGILVFGGTLVSIYRSFSWIDCNTCLILSRIFWSNNLFWFFGSFSPGGTLVSIYRSFSWFNCTTCLILSRMFWSKQFVVFFGSFSPKLRVQLSIWKSQMESALKLCQMLSLSTREWFGVFPWKHRECCHMGTLS